MSTCGSYKIHSWICLHLPLPLQLQCPLLLYINSTHITIFNNTMTVNFASVLWKTQMELMTLQTWGLSLIPRKHSTEPTADRFHFVLKQMTSNPISNRVRIPQASDYLSIPLYIRISTQKKHPMVIDAIHLPASQVVLKPGVATAWPPSRNILRQYSTYIQGSLLRIHTYAWQGNYYH